MKPFEHLKEKIRESAHLNSAMALLSWDQEVMMPPGGTNFRAETIATLSGMYHDMMVIGVADALKAVEDVLKTDDKAAIDEKSNALMTVSQKLGEKMYADMQAKGGAEAAAAAGGASSGAAAEGGSQQRANDDDVVDAEVKEVKKG